MALRFISDQHNIRLLLLKIGIRVLNSACFNITEYQLYDNNNYYTQHPQVIRSSVRPAVGKIQINIVSSYNTNNNMPSVLAKVLYTILYLL